MYPNWTCKLTVLWKSQLSRQKRVMITRDTALPAGYHLLNEAEPFLDAERRWIQEGVKSGLASAPLFLDRSASDRCKDRSLGVSCTSTRKTKRSCGLRALNIFAVKKKFISRGVEALSILPNLVDLSKNWRGMHGGKKQNFFRLSSRKVAASSIGAGCFDLVTQPAD